MNQEPLPAEYVAETITNDFIGMSVCRARRKVIYVRTLIVGVMVLVYPIDILLLFCLAFVIGGLVLR